VYFLSFFETIVKHVYQYEHDLKKLAHISNKFSYLLFQFVCALHKAANEQ